MARDPDKAGDEEHKSLVSNEGRQVTRKRRRRRRGGGEAEGKKGNRGSTARNYHFSISRLTLLIKTKPLDGRRRLFKARRGVSTCWRRRPRRRRHLYQLCHQALSSLSPDDAQSSDLGAAQSNTKSNVSPLRFSPYWHSSLTAAPVSLHCPPAQRLSFPPLCTVPWHSFCLSSPLGIYLRTETQLYYTASSSTTSNKLPPSPPPNCTLCHTTNQ